MPDATIDDRTDLTLEQKLKNRTIWFAQQLHVHMPRGAQFAIVMCREGGNDPMMYAGDIPPSRMAGIFEKAAREARIHAPLVSLHGHAGDKV